MWRIVFALPQLLQEAYSKTEICIQAFYWGEFPESIPTERMKETGLNRQSFYLRTKSSVNPVGNTSWDDPSKMSSIGVRVVGLFIVTTC